MLNHVSYKFWEFERLKPVTVKAIKHPKQKRRQMRRETSPLADRYRPRRTEAIQMRISSAKPWATWFRLSPSEQTTLSSLSTNAFDLSIAHLWSLQNRNRRQWWIRREIVGEAADIQTYLSSGIFVCLVRLMAIDTSSNQSQPEYDSVFFKESMLTTLFKRSRVFLPFSQLRLLLDCNQREYILVKFQEQKVT